MVTPTLSTAVGVTAPRAKWAAPAAGVKAPAYVRVVWPGAGRFGTLGWGWPQWASFRNVVE